MDDKALLKDYIVKNCIHFSYDSDSGPKVLKNQAYLFDLRELTMDPIMGQLAARLIWERIKKYEPGCLFTHGIGGAPLLTNIQIIAASEGKNLYTLICRDARKPSNRQRLVEGKRPDPNTRAIFIDDVVNSGDTYRQSLEALEVEGITLRVLGAAGILSMWAYSGTRLLEAQGKVSEFLFRRQDLGITRAFPTDELLGDLLTQVATYNESDLTDIKSPPVIDGNLLIWATDDQVVRCLNITTNELQWIIETPISGGIRSKGIVNKILVTDQHVFFNTYSGTAYKVEKTSGQIVWGVHIGKWVHASTTISNDMTKLFIGTEDINPEDESAYGNLVCLDSETGLLIWSTRFNEYVPCTAHVVNDRVLIGCNDNTISCLSQATGSTWWKQTLKGSVKGKVNNIGNIVCATTENGYIYFIDMYSGDIIKELVGSRGFRHNFVQVYSEKFIVVDIDGLIKCYDTTGTLTWINRVRGALSWYPTIKDDIMYVVTDSGFVFTLNAQTGEKLKYSYVMKDDGTGINKTVVQCPPAVGDGVIAFNTNNKGLLLYDFSN